MSIISSSITGVTILVTMGLAKGIASFGSFGYVNLLLVGCIACCLHVVVAYIDFRRKDNIANRVRDGLVRGVYKCQIAVLKPVWISDAVVILLAGLVLGLW